MSYDLAALTKRIANPRRSAIVLREIKPPATRATDLYASGFRPIIEAWTAALPGIIAEYERSLAEMTTDAPSDLGVRIEAVERSNAGLMVALRLRIARWAEAFESWHRAKWRASVLSATKVSLDTLIGPAEARLTVEAAIERNVALVRSVSDETRRRISDTVFRGLQQQTPARDVARTLREAVGIERRRALRISADQNVKINAALNEERRREAGIASWLWVHSDKRNPRPEHDARDGFLYSEDPALIGQTYEGRVVRKVPEDKPGELPYCGCTSRAVVVL